jgi:hypothetical protein
MCIRLRHAKAESEFTTPQKGDLSSSTAQGWHRLVSKSEQGNSMPTQSCRDNDDNDDDDDDDTHILLFVFVGLHLIKLSQVVFYFIN